MDDILNLEKLSTLLVAVSCLAPGFIISFIRSKFITGRLRSISKVSMEYLVASAIYFSAAGPLFIPILGYAWHTVFVFLFVLPALVGIALGIVAQKDLLGPTLARFGLKVVHPMPTSWDYVFANLRAGSWVVVTLKNYEQLYGFFGGNSFASSELGRQDLYIEDMRDFNWGRLEGDGRARGLWVSESEIAMIEIITDEVSK